jgi:hypothetical protein
VVLGSAFLAVGGRGSGVALFREGGGEMERDALERVSVCSILSRFDGRGEGVAMLVVVEIREGKTSELGRQQRRRVEVFASERRKRKDRWSVLGARKFNISIQEKVAELKLLQLDLVFDVGYSW